MILAMLAAAALSASAPPPVASNAAPLDPAAVKAVEATAYDYVDGQLEGDVARVARSLHPDLAKRAIRSKPDPDETLGLRRMNRDELVDLTRQGALKTPREQWNRSVRVLDIAGNVAVARVETPWFVDHLNLGRFGDRWVIVNALWYPKPRPPAAKS
ncbi:nuclear transport factor 2 family protein [Caulobacter endophyticus]|uniref:nuclear transport factor 2 family protein n=1 Tax=Caulobacter endophyticus TaxID=2172652 RepID=UPI00241013D5|nr:nuclear transport factor 2 family protein [Caulobacter endophyticus]MDG2529246.1 nuclear transport factor 2 family protein [Caulobacter endophyticus]